MWPSDKSLMPVTTMLRRRGETDVFDLVDERGEVTRSGTYDGLRPACWWGPPWLDLRHAVPAWVLEQLGMPGS